MLLAAFVSAGKYKFHHDGTPITRFDYSSRMWLMFAAAATSVSNYSLCDIGSADGAGMRDGAAAIGLKGRLRGYDISNERRRQYSNNYANRKGLGLPEVRMFDGRKIPESDRSFDVVSFVAVLHHAADNTESLLHEAVRVSREWVLVLEDVMRSGDREAIKETRRHDPKGIFRTKEEWDALFAKVGLSTVAFGPQWDRRAISHYWILRLAHRPNPCRERCFRDPNTPRLVLNGTIDMPAGARVWHLPKERSAM